MSKLGIGTGITPDDGNGDSLLEGAVKVNSNFNEIYSYFGDGTDLTSGSWQKVTSGINTTLNVGIGTTNPRFALEVGAVGASGTSLYVNGDARVTGILTVGSSSITLDGDNNKINVGSGVTIEGSTGIINATSVVLGGAELTGSGIVTSIAAGSGISIDQATGKVTITATGGGGGGESYWASTAAGIHTLSNVGIGSTIPTSALTVQGDVSVSGVTTLGTTLNIGESSSLIYSQPDIVLSSTYSGGKVKLRGPSGVEMRTYGTSQLVAYFASNPGNIGYVDLYYDGQRKFRTLESGVTITGLTDTDQLNVSGVSTFGSASDLTISYFDSIDTNFIYSDEHDLFIGTKAETGGNVNYIALVGIHTGNDAYSSNTSSVSLRYGNSETKLQTIGTGVTVTGTTFTDQLSVSGVVTATTFVGNFSGSITDATNLTGGYANASQLNVSGVTTISQGRIQADASSNLRFGNLPAGSGSGRNIAIGDQVLASLSGGSGRNIGIGELSYYDTTTGQYNIGVGERAGQKVSTGSYNVILGAYDGNSGNLDIRTSSRNVVIADGEGNIRQYINSSGNVGIKTTVVTEALTVAGVVSATSFYGTLNAGQLTGALPAIDGSALIGVVGSGSGIVIEDNATPVGTAGTINFGSNLSVSFASGIATVSATSDIAGINTSGTSTFNRLTVSGVSTFTGNVYTRNIAIDTGYTIIANNTGGTYHQLGGVQDFDLLLYKARGTGSISNKSINILNGTLGTGGGSDLSVFKVYGDGGLRSYYHTISGGFAIQSERFSVTGGDSSGATPTEVIMKVGSGVTAYGSGVIYSTGSVTATSFSGSAAGLTNIPSGQLTGALPAIDGSALLNVTAVGTGVVVEDDTVNVGSATTIDFGTGLDVTFSAGIATITASGGSLQSRTVVTGVTTSITNNGIGNTNITGFKSYALMKVGLSTAGWLRLYTDSASRDADVSRSVGIDPTPGSGVIAEVVTTGISTTQIISPFVMGGNLDNPADTTIYAAITNLSGSTQAITANLTILQLEA